jgi:hypothetical protein
VSKLKILLSGMVAAVPNQGGAAWAVLQFFLGLRRLGHDVCFVEECGRDEIRPAGAPFDQSENASYFRKVMSRLDLEQDAAFLLRGTTETVGSSYEEVRAFAREADLLLNISGRLRDEALLDGLGTRVYVDLDPAFNQVWHNQGIDVGFGGHTHHVTVGQAVGTPECRVPTGGFEWTPMLPPVVLERWPRSTRIAEDAFTTVGNWRGYGSVTHEGVQYGQKAHSLRQFISLPRDTGERFLLAMAIDPGEEKDIAALDENGWEIVDPMGVTDTLDGYQAFLQDSKAEFGIAKSGYVASRCGWFSDRSACYLASGKPVIAQETGFSRFLPAGEGLFAFDVAEDVIAAIGELESDYARHSEAARDIAEEYLDSDKVLGRLLETVAGG